MCIHTNTGVGHEVKVFVCLTIDFKAKVDNFIFSEIDIALQCTAVGEVRVVRSSVDLQLQSHLLDEHL